MSSLNCEQFMKGYTDANATDKEKLEYAQCVNDNVYLVSSHGVYDNPALMFATIFVIILMLMVAVNAYVKKTARKNQDQHDKK